MILDVNLKISNIGQIVGNEVFEAVFNYAICFPNLKILNLKYTYCSGRRCDVCEIPLEATKVMKEKMKYFTNLEVLNLSSKYNKMK